MSEKKELPPCEIEAFARKYFGLPWDVCESDHIDIDFGTLVDFGYGLKSEWTAIESELPANNGYYICWCGFEPGLIHFHTKSGWQNGYNDRVTHWRNIIPPPSKADNNPEPDYDNQAREQQEDREWAEQPTPYDP